MSKKENKAILSHLKTLLLHIIKWNDQPKKRSRSWEKTIQRAKNDIKNSQKKKPSLNDNYLEQHWEETQEKAVKAAEKEMDQKATKTEVSWDEAFKLKYILPFVLLIISFALLALEAVKQFTPQCSHE